MMSSPLARKAVAFGASTVVLAGMVAALAAGPAQAGPKVGQVGPAAAQAGPKKPQPKVSVSTPKATQRDYAGACPIKVNVSAKISVKATGKTTLAYRWLHGDGSKSKVKTVRIKGHGTKTVTVKQSATFKDDVKKGWEAVQVLSPRKVTSKKGYFSVTCAKVVELKEVTKVSVRAWASPSSYVGSCTPGTKIDFTGLIRVSDPSWVRYRWILNGKVVDYGKTKVWRSKKVGFGISPRSSEHGYAVLQVLGPDRAYSNKAHYKVLCKSEAPATRVAVTDLVTATNHDGCKVGAHAVVRSTGPGRVEYVWSLNGQRVLRGDTVFNHGGKRTVTLPEKVLTGAATKGGKITLTVFGPRNSDSITQSYAACEAPKPTVSVSAVTVAGQRNEMCADKRGPGVDFKATLTSTGPTTVKYYWVVNGKRDHNTLERQVNGSLDVQWGVGGTHGASVTSGSIELVVISPNATSSGAAQFTATCPAPSTPAPAATPSA
ncbi:hypothetical protein [Nonomuraea cavernae]|uniref:Ig-like domain-containing protein n=1 Tax=Nonomuraea cavernae TaxID=2045107 RepID=A0A917YWK8_9ACTN|nr:hypothetical protein [Nonomuraea cavernae]MCA2186830.1 hypothetical protein [Nonomuraea cavernae]GGO67461.1 hypothetical protein GCM10012289_23940 [Nonomuraea cavernae]